MSTSSDLSSPKRRVPQQGRGERRVAALLDAAEAVIVDRGYDAATMTEMAERAGASIGAMYQYFPNKEAVARAIRTRDGDEMDARLKPLTATAAGLSITELIDRLLAVVIEVMESRPAFIAMLSAPVSYTRDRAARNRLRESFADLFRMKRPDLTPEVAFRIANVTLQVVKGMSLLYAQPDAAEREALVREFKMVLTTYLGARLHG